MTEKYNRNFEGIWIPANIWLSEELTMQEKIFLVEIKSLDREQGCFASNEHFSKLFQLSKSRCSEVINKLKQKGLINVQITYKEGSKQIERRTIRVNRYHPIFNEGIRLSEVPIREVDEGIRKTEEPPSGNAKDNNTFINNTSKYKEEEKGPSNPFTFYQENGFGVLSGYIADKLNHWIDDLSEEHLIYAMQLAVENNSIRWNYVEKILKDWFNRNLKTMEQVHAARAQFDAQKGGKSNGASKGSNATSNGRTEEEMEILAKLKNYNSADYR